MSKKSRIQRLESFSKQRKKLKSKQVNNKTSKQVDKKTKKLVYIRKTYFIDPEFHNQLKLIAVKENKNVSFIVRAALKEYLKK